MISRDELPYRQSTLAYITNSEGKFLLVNKNNYDLNQWSFPGGGVDREETPRQAVIRELEEELLSTKFEILSQSKIPYRYEWPGETIETAYQKYGLYFRGTELTQFWVKFTGKDDEVHPGDGIRTVKWVAREDLKSHLIFPNQHENAEKVINEFTPS